MKFRLSTFSLSPLFENTIKKYHKDTHETQVAASAPDATAESKTGDTAGAALQPATATPAPGGAN